MDTSHARSLGAKNKFQFVDGSILILAPHDHVWERCNNLIHSWLANSVSSLIAQSIIFIENVIDVWKESKGTLFPTLFILASHGFGDFFLTTLMALRLDISKKKDALKATTTKVYLHG